MSTHLAGAVYALILPACYGHNQPCLAHATPATHFSVWQALSKGEVLFTVPLRLALADREVDAAEQHQQISWYVRLATRILKERRDPSSAWHPYLQVCQPLLEFSMLEHGSHAEPDQRGKALNGITSSHLPCKPACTCMKFQ